MRRLLWIDAGAGALAGTLVLAVELASGHWLSGLYGLPHSLLVFIGAANLSYAGFSFSLAMCRSRPLAWVGALATANMVWAGVCVYMAWQWAGAASVFGQLHLIAEAAFVSALAACEWRNRHLLCSAWPAWASAEAGAAP